MKDKSAHLPRLMEMVQYENVKITYTSGDEEKTIFKSLGNESGLHSFAAELRREKFEKSGPGIQKKLSGLLAAGAQIIIYRYSAINRDRGTWKKISIL